MANQETKKNTKRKNAASAQEKKSQSSVNANKQNISTQGDAPENRECQFMRMYKDHPNTVVLTLLGLIIALCFIFIGFWATLLIILFTGAGFIYGQYKDKELWVYYMLKRLLK